MEVIGAAVILGVAVVFLSINLALVGWAHYTRNDVDRPLPQKKGETGIRYLIRIFTVLESHGVVAVSKRIKWLMSRERRGDFCE